MTINQALKCSFPTDFPSLSRTEPVHSAAGLRLLTAAGSVTTTTALDAITRALWTEVVDGTLREAEAASLQAYINDRRTSLSGRRTEVARGVQPPPLPRRRPVSPDRQKSIRRRRRTGGLSALPTPLCEHFTEGERAALTIIARHVKAAGRCDLPLDKIAALAGVGRSTTQNAIREARRLGLLSVKLRPRKGAKNLPNIIHIVDKTWLAWLARGAKDVAGDRVQSFNAPQIFEPHEDRKIRMPANGMLDSLPLSTHSLFKRRWDNAV